jgi:hypothetical protein
MRIEECEGYKKSRAAVERDIELRGRTRREATENDEKLILSWLVRQGIGRPEEE